MTTALVVVPNDLQLPAHLRTAEAAATIAAKNAAAAGGIRSGGFARISKDGGKFHIVDAEGNDTPLMNPEQRNEAGQLVAPATPMMFIRVAVVDGNPALSRIYYKDKKVEGVNVAPTCTSTNGVTPDRHIAQPQATHCANCPQAVWGSRISEYSKKPIPACGQHKQTAVFPVDPAGTADTRTPYGLAFTVSELTEWGNYVKALDGKGASVQAVITNLTFATDVSHPKLLASFGGFLSEPMFNAVVAREQDADVQAIVAPAGRTAAPSGAPALPPPPVMPSLPPPAAVIAPVAPPVPPQPPLVAPPAASVPGFGAVPPAAVTAAAAAPAAPVNGFGAPAAVAAPVAAAAPAAEPPKNKRRTRAEMEAAKGPVDPRIAHLTPEQQSVIASTGGAGGAVAQALLLQFPAPAALADMPAPATGAALPPPVAAVAPVAAAAASNGFGGAPVAAAVPPPAAPSQQAMDLQAKLMAKLTAGGNVVAPVAGATA